MDRKRKDKITLVKEMLAGCPLGTPLDTCPASKFRRLPLSEIVKFVNGMSARRLDAIIAYHKNCQKHRDDMYQTKTFEKRLALY